MLRDIGATMAAAEAAEAAETSWSAEAAEAARVPGEALGAPGEAVAAAVETETKGAAGAAAARGCRRQAMLVHAMRAGFARLHAAAQQAEREGVCTPDAHLVCTLHLHVHLHIQLHMLSAHVRAPGGVRGGTGTDAHTS